MNSIGIHLDDISASYRGRNDVVSVFRDVSFSIDPGTFFVLLGPSGCGKTTLLRLIAGLHSPDSGTIRFGDRLVFDADRGVDLKPADREISFVFQNISLYPNMSVFQNIEFPLRIRKIASREERNRIVRDTARLLQIEDVLDRRISRLSGGQRQRVAVGKALVREPNLFLMDEPISNLDQELRSGIRGYFRNLQRKVGITSIYVTHDQREAMVLADRIAVLAGGEVQQVGTPREIYERPANISVADFMGRTPMNIFDGTLVAEDSTWYFNTDFGRMHLDQAIARKLRQTGRRECKLGIRPEFISITPRGQGNVDARVHLMQNTGGLFVLYAFLGDLKPVTIESRRMPEGLNREETVGLSFETAKLNVFTTAGDRIEI